MTAKRWLVYTIATLLCVSGCTGSLGTPLPTARPSPAPTATVERLDYYPEGTDRPFRYQLSYSSEALTCGFGNPCTLEATYREPAPSEGYPEGTAFIFEMIDSAEPVSLAIPANYADRMHLTPGSTYQIIAQTMPNWPDTFGLMIRQGKDLVFLGVSDWRFDASIHLGCLSPVRVEQSSVLAQRYREGDQCLGRFTNTEMRFSMGEVAETLHQGESATIGDLDVDLELARILDRSYCPDAGAINVSYTISKGRDGEPGIAPGTAQTPELSIGAAEQISVPDANLEAHLRRLTHQETGPLLASDLEALPCFVRLYPVDWGAEGSAIQDTITSLRGLEYATNLEAIYLGGASITDLSPLTTLSRLRILRIDHSELTDLSPLASLTSLTHLWASNNRVSDLSPLSSLSRLTVLDLDDNGIRDVTPLSALANLADLSLYHNEIQDISALSSMNNLRRLRLDLNQIRDVSAVSTMVNLDSLSIDDNQVDDVAPLSALANLTELSLVRNSVTDISALSPLANLVALYAGDNQISRLSALENLPNLRLIDLQSNRVTDLSPLVGNVGLGEGDWLDLRGNPLNADSLNRHIPVLESRGVILSW